MRATIVREYELSCAHRLTAGVPETHRCRRPHGHSYRLELAISAEIGADGMVFEYGVLDVVAMPVLRELDHNDLNTVSSRISGAPAVALSENPTVELLAAFLVWALRDLYAKLDASRGSRLEYVRIREDGRSSVEVRP